MMQRRLGHNSWVRDRWLHLVVALVALPLVSAAPSARNQGLELTVHAQSLQEEFGPLAASDGGRFLVLDAQFTSVIGEDLVFRHDVPQRIELASLRHKVFLHWDGRTVCRLDQERQLRPGHLPNEIVLSRHGSKRRGELVFEVPGAAMKPATLVYFHDGFGPLEVALGGEPAEAMPAPEGSISNQAIELAITSFEKRPSLKGKSAPAGWTFAVVTLAGKGGFPWTTRAVMIAGEEAESEAEASFQLPFEYFEAPLSLVMVADGEVAFSYDPALSEAGETLTFLPGRWAEYELVYTVPAETASLALEALFGRMGLGFEKGEVLDPVVFPLEGEPPAAAAEAVSFLDEKDGYRFAISMSDLEQRDEFHGVRSEEGEGFLSMTVRASYAGPEPGRDALHRRFFLLLPGGLPRPADEATSAGPFRPLTEYSLVPGTRRRFELVFAVPAAFESTTLNFSGPGQVHQVPLARTADGWAVAGPVVSLSSLEIETRALVKRDDDGHIAPADELASDVRRPRPENIKPEWRKRWAVERDSPDAELLVRVGDIDNFGFGWPDGYDPFSGETLKSHPYPWKPDPRDPPGTDRIMVVSSYEGRGTFDGYTSGTERPLNNVQDVVFSFDAKGLEIGGAKMRMFLDDFQPEKLGSRFQVSLDEARLPAVEEVINALNQTGPVGKMVTVALPEEVLGVLADGEVALRIDDVETGTGDGFAIDFVEILINPHEGSQGGTVRGTVLDANTNQPVAGALVSAGGVVEAESIADGTFELRAVPAGLSVVSAARSGYRTATASRDLAPGGAVTVEFSLSPESAGETLRKEGRAVVRGVRFDTDSAVLRPESEAVLRDLLAVLEEKRASTFRIEGHTDAEGSAAYNLDLSRRRAQAVADWFETRGVAEERLRPEGFGETRPVATNKTETGRGLNRRVEVVELGK